MDDTADPSRRPDFPSDSHAVVVGRDATTLSTFGFALARRLHRPFFDFAHHGSNVGAETGGLDPRQWLERVVAVSAPAVVALPPVEPPAGESSPGSMYLPLRWIVLADAADVLTSLPTDEVVSVQGTTAEIDDLIPRFGHVP